MAAKKPKYRLQVLLVLKERAKRQTEIELARAIKRLEEEKKKLEELEEKKVKLIQRIEDERTEMRVKVSSGDAVVKDPQVHLNYIRNLKEKLEELEKKIEDQKEEVKMAEKGVQRARSDYVLAAQEMDVMKKHKELWEKKLKKEMNEADNKIMNELGNVIHQMNKGKT